MKLRNQSVDKSVPQVDKKIKKPKSKKKGSKISKLNQLKRTKTVIASIKESEIYLQRQEKISKDKNKKQDKCQNKSKSPIPSKKIKKSASKSLTPKKSISKSSSPQKKRITDKIKGKQLKKQQKNSKSPSVNKDKKQQKSQSPANLKDKKEKDKMEEEKKEKSKKDEKKEKSKKDEKKEKSKKDEKKEESKKDEKKEESKKDEKKEKSKKDEKKEESKKDKKDEKKEKPKKESKKEKPKKEQKKEKPKKEKPKKDKKDEASSSHPPVIVRQPSKLPDDQKQLKRQESKLGQPGYPTAGIIDAVFCMDTTGSMGSYLAQAKSVIDTIITKIDEKVKGTKIDVKFGFVAYRDHPPQDTTYVTKFQQLDNEAAVKEFIEGLNTLPGGGGDFPEAVMDGLMESAKSTKWRDSTEVPQLRYIFHICDAPPHGKDEFGSTSAVWNKGCPCGIKTNDIAHQINLHQIHYRLIKIGTSLEKMSQVFKEKFTNFDEQPISAASNLEIHVTDMIMRELLPDF